MHPGPGTAAADLEAVAERLAAMGCVAASTEASELVAAAPDVATLERWLRRRATGEPLAWILGRVEFCGVTVLVDPGVFVPRAQSEALARRAAALLAHGGRRAADLCTGSGAIARYLALAAPAARVVATDIDPRAVTCARRNGVLAIEGDLGAPLVGAAFDVVTAVAPYVPTAAIAYLPRDVRRHEPRHALEGGADGLAVVRRVVAAAGRLLRPGGWLLVEVGGDQAEALAPVLAVGWVGAESWCDDDGELRGLVARRRG